MPQVTRAHVFADVRGYGRIVEEKGDAIALKSLRAYARIVRAALPKHGVIAEQTADTFYLVFTSVPEAVRSSAAIADALAKHNRSHPDLPLPVSIGIDAGLTVRHRGGHAGAAPVVASRLMRRGKPGQVLASEAVAALLRTSRTPMRDLGISRLDDGQTMHVYEIRPPDEAGGHEPPVERFLATVLFTDIVQSTAVAAERGHKGWRDLFERHHAITREELRRHGGAEVDTAGDGFYATLDSPSRAIDCAIAIRDRVKSEVGIDIRAGVHVGECEVVAGKVGGMTVVVGGRIKDLGGAGDLLVSQTVKDVMVGGPVQFKERGRVALKGVPGEWSLYEVIGLLSQA
jgi:class 3 adenylate cyclase